MRSTIQGTYGSHETPCTIFTFETSQGTWYVIEGSVNVNCTAHIENGVDVESVPDYDMFTASYPIESESELERAVNE